MHIALLMVLGWQTNFKTTEEAALNHLLQAAKQHQLQSMPQRVSQVGQLLLGKPYEEKTLEQQGPEHLVIYFGGFDCTTFCEVTLVLTRLLNGGESGMEAYRRELQNLRYRKGEIAGYTSRLHYITDWAFDGEKKGWLRDITQELGGIPFPQKLSFMSSHPQSYPALRTNPDDVPLMTEIEANINQRDYWYIPKHAIEQAEPHIRTGDIIAFTTTIKGLDFVHMGIAVRKEDGHLHLLHASSAAKAVVLSEKTLRDYTAGIRAQSGIMVFRPL